MQQGERPWPLKITHAGRVAEGVYLFVHLALVRGDGREEVAVIGLGKNAGNAVV